MTKVFVHMSEVSDTFRKETYSDLIIPIGSCNLYKNDNITLNAFRYRHITAWKIKEGGGGEREDKRVADKVMENICKREGLLG